MIRLSIVLCLRFTFDTLPRTEEQAMSFDSLFLPLARIFYTWFGFWFFMCAHSIVFSEGSNNSSIHSFWECCSLSKYMRLYVVNSVYIIWSNEKRIILHSVILFLTRKKNGICVCPLFHGIMIVNFQCGMH